MFLNSNFAGTGHAKNGFDKNSNTHLPSIWSCLEIRKLSPAKQKQSLKIRGCFKFDEIDMVHLSAKMKLTS